ncbi:MAG TPA: hypothetical protein VN688_02755 [Gemmataceae bacterium]|nr:hypothetical protein [Gemmataceae bacterium]
MFKPSRFQWTLILMPALLLLTGCGSSDTVRVTGTVQRDGKPVPNLIVNFVPAEGRPSWGITDEKGAFMLAHDKKTAGAVRGTHRVYVKYHTRDPKEDIAFHQGTLKLSPEMKAILAKYGQMETTPLRYEITKDGQAIDVVLD